MLKSDRINVYYLFSFFFKNLLKWIIRIIKNRVRKTLFMVKLGNGENIIIDIMMNVYVGKFILS